MVSTDMQRFVPSAVRCAAVFALAALGACGQGPETATPSPVEPRTEAPGASGLDPDGLAGPALPRPASGAGRVDEALGLGAEGRPDRVLRTVGPAILEELPPHGTDYPDAVPQVPVGVPPAEVGEIENGVLDTTFESEGGVPLLRVSAGSQALRFKPESLRVVSAAGAELAAESAAAQSGMLMAGARADYAGVFRSSALRFVLRRNAVKQELWLRELPQVLEEAGALPQGARLEVSESLRLPAGAGLLLPDGEGGLQFRAAPVTLVTGGAIGIGAPGEPWFVLLAPFAIDAAGERVELEAEISVQAGGSATYRTRVPAAWLADAARSYPVLVDPPVAAGAPVPYLAAAQVERFPVNGVQTAAWAALTIHDALRASADFTLETEVFWGDGSSDLLVGPGGHTLSHDYGGVSACGASHRCEVRIRSCDALARCSEELMSFILPLGPEDDLACRYTCRYQAAEEVLRSFWHRVPDCGICQADMAARCTEPPPVETACQVRGGCDPTLGFGCNPASDAPICDPGQTTCRGCGGDAECAGNPVGGQCLGDGSCAACDPADHAGCGGLAPFCEAGSCRGCVDDDDCAAAGGGPACQPDGSCGGCLANADCDAGSAAPACGATNQCEACDSHADCAGNPNGEHCLGDGSCGSFSVVPNSEPGAFEGSYMKVTLDLFGTIGQVLGAPLEVQIQHFLGVGTVGPDDFFAPSAISFPAGVGFGAKVEFSIDALADAVVEPPDVGELVLVSPAVAPADAQVSFSIFDVQTAPVLSAAPALAVAVAAGTTQPLAPASTVVNGGVAFADNSTFMVNQHLAGSAAGDTLFLQPGAGVTLAAGVVSVDGLEIAVVAPASASASPGGSITFSVAGAALSANATEAAVQALIRRLSFSTAPGTGGREAAFSLVLLNTVNQDTDQIRIPIRN